MGLVHLAVRTVMWCALSVALGAVLSPIMAGFATVTILTVAPRLGLLMLHADAAWLRAAGALAYYASPALMPADLMRHGVESELWNPRWILYGAVLAENALYVTAALAVACLVFSRREIRLG